MPNFAILSIFSEKNFANPKTHQGLREGRRHHLPAGLHDRIAVNYGVTARLPAPRTTSATEYPMQMSKESDSQISSKRMSA